MTANATGHATEHTADPGASVWDTAFVPAEQKELLEDDRQAWYGITGLLMAIICGGVSLFGFCAWLMSRLP